MPPPPCFHQPPSFLHTITTTTSIRRGLLTRRRASGNDDGELIDGVVKNTAVACILGSSGTLWSEFSVATTGCGPATLGDVLERGCYYSAFGLAAVSVFTRIAFGLSVMESLDRLLDDTDLLPLTSLQVKIAESLAQRMELCQGRCRASLAPNFGPCMLPCATAGPSSTLHRIAPSL